MREPTKKPSHSVIQPEIAVFGGTFDPPHTGHVMALSYVAATENPARILMIPTWKHPLGKEPLAPFEHRKAMCERATQHLSQVEVSDLEARLGGTSHTLRTLEALSKNFPNHSLRWVMGSDILGQTAQWKDFDKIEKLAPPILLPRGGHHREHQGKNTRGIADTFPWSLPEISSATIRQHLHLGENTGTLVPKSVLHYIQQHRLYGAAGAQDPNP